MNKYVLIPIMLLLIIITITSSSAFNREQISTPSNSRWRKIDVDLLYSYSGSAVHSIDNTGKFQVEVIGNGIGAEEYVANCVVPTYDTHTCLVMCDSGTNICGYDYDADDWKVYHNLPAPLQNDTNRLVSAFNNTFIMTSYGSTNYSYTIFNDTYNDITSNITIEWEEGGNKLWFGAKDFLQQQSPTDEIWAFPAETIYETGLGQVILSGAYAETSLDVGNIHYKRWVYNETHLFNQDGLSAGGNCYRYDGNNPQGFNNSHFHSDFHYDFHRENKLYLIKPNCYGHFYIDNTDVDAVGIDYITNYAQDYIEENNPSSGLLLLYFGGTQVNDEDACFDVGGGNPCFNSTEMMMIDPFIGGELTIKVLFNGTAIIDDQADFPVNDYYWGNGTYDTPASDRTYYTKYMDGGAIVYQKNFSTVYFVNDLGSECGDAVCDGLETVLTCPVDCPASCGDSYCTHTEDSISCPVDCPAGGGNETFDYYYYPEDEDIPPYEPPEVYDGMKSLKVINNTHLLVGFHGDDDELILFNTQNYSNIINISQADLKDVPYDIDYEGDQCFVGTDNEVHSISGVSSLNLLLEETDGWLVLTDKATSVIMINETNGFACHSSNKFYYYTAGDTLPLTGDGNTCYDMEYDENKKVLYVVAGENGLSSYNVTDPENPVLLDTIGDNSLPMWEDWGDYIDIRGDLLITPVNLILFNLYNISDPSDMTYILGCNNQLTGVIRSVEIVNDDLAVAGLNDFRISVCNITDTNQSSNTNTYDVPDFLNHPITHVEMADDGYLRIMNNFQLGFYQLTLGNTTENLPPTINNYTVSDTNPFINQPVVFSINESGADPEDIIHYGFDCEGNDNWIDITNPDYTCYYNISGEYNARIGISDNFHTGTWYDQRVIPITVQEAEFEGGIINVFILTEAQTAIENAQVNTNNETKFSNSLGFVTFTTPTTGLYEVSTQKSGYYNSVDNFYADGLNNAVYLVLVPTGNETVLEVTVIDSNGAYVESALVSYTNTITYEFDYKWTNALGFVVFTDVSSGTLSLSVSKDEFESSYTTIYASNGVTTSTTVVLEGEVEGVYHEDRDCIDDGVWLCGDTQQSCISDSECLSDDCTVSGICGKFNMSICDENNYPRGQKCIYKYTFESWMGGITSWLLGNLLWVIILLILIVAFAIIGMAMKK